MSITNDQKIDVFKAELKMISDSRIKEFIKLCIMSAPDYFFTDCPASTSGKYHSIDELSWDGGIIHTKRVFVTAYTMSRALDIEDNRDVIAGAALIHDLLKQGVKKTGHTVKNHPQLAADLVERIQNETGILSKSEFEIIYNSVKFHYGPWSAKNIKKPMTEYTLEELCVYLSDYVASKRFIKVTYKGDCYE